MQAVGMMFFVMVVNFLVVVVLSMLKTKGWNKSYENLPDGKRKLYIDTGFTFDTKSFNWHWRFVLSVLLIHVVYLFVFVYLPVTSVISAVIYMSLATLTSIVFVNDEKSINSNNK